ncbi:MAG: ATP-dependent zinc metalloprotease FtsH [bacterium]|nr:ATP-dependent zinc metalloprotease FtsH [bacterium]
MLKINIKKLALFSLIAVLLLLFAANFRAAKKHDNRITYTQFVASISKDKVDQVKIVKDEIRGTTRDGKEFLVIMPFEDGRLPQMLEQHGVNVEGARQQAGWWETPLFQMFLFVGVFAILWLFIIRQAQNSNSQAMMFGRSRAKTLAENWEKVTFDDVAGVEEAKQELREVVDFLKDRQKFQALGAKIPKGVLLLGPPGCGKTLLSRAVAGEAEVPFFYISGSDFVEMFVGVGASRVRDLFNQAKEKAPCIIFIDEIDAVGRQRGTGLGGGHDEREQTLNQLLVEMDGFDANLGVVLVAATNRPDVLDPALLRPGRFDRRVIVDNPDVVGRNGILKVHVKGKPMAEDVDLEVLARRTPGFSGADLANLVNEAALLAARRDRADISMAELEASIDKVIAGPERKSRLINEREREIIAFHEAGHALVAKQMPTADPVHKISILPRGMALGYTMQLPVEDTYLTAKTHLKDQIAVLLGGRVAETLRFDDVTTGAQNDLERATAIARQMVCAFGMSDELGPVTFGRKQGQVFLGRDLVEERNYSEEVARKIDAEVKSLLLEGYERANTVLAKEKDLLALISAQLLEKETLEGELLEELLDGRYVSVSVSDSADTVEAGTVEAAEAMHEENS